MLRMAVLCTMVLIGPGCGDGVSGVGSGVTDAATGADGQLADGQLPDGRVVDATVNIDGRVSIDGAAAPQCGTRVCGAVAPDIDCGVCPGTQSCTMDGTCVAECPGGRPSPCVDIHGMRHCAEGLGILVCDGDPQKKQVSSCYSGAFWIGAGGGACF